MIDIEVLFCEWHQVYLQGPLTVSDHSNCKPQPFPAGDARVIALNHLHQIEECLVKITIAKESK